MGGFGGGPEWIAQLLELRFRAAPGPGEFSPIPANRVVVYTPPAPEQIRGVCAWEDAADPLTPAGGAAQVRLGMDDNISETLLAFANIATWNDGEVLGHGRAGPEDHAQIGRPNALADAGITLIAATQHDGTNPVGNIRRLTVSSDAGTVTGGIFLFFERRPIAL